MSTNKKQTPYERALALLKDVRDPAIKDATPGQLKAAVKEKGVKLDYNESRRLQRAVRKFQWNDEDVVIQRAIVPTAKVNAPSQAARYTGSHG